MLHTYNMDEYTDEQGRGASESWKFGGGHAFKKYFWARIEPKPRPQGKQIHCITNKTINGYGKILTDLGGADICYRGPDWTRHLAFIEPEAPELAGSPVDWKKGPTHLHP